MALYSIPVELSSTAAVLRACLSIVPPRWWEAHWLWQYPVATNTLRATELLHAQSGLRQLLARLARLALGPFQRAHAGELRSDWEARRGGSCSASNSPSRPQKGLE